MAPVASSFAPIVDPIPSIPPTTAAKDKVAARKRFEAVYSIVRDDLLADFRKHNMPEESIEYYRRVRNPCIYPSLALSSSLPNAEYGLQRPRWKTQPRSERRRLGRYPQGPRAYRLGILQGGRPRLGRRMGPSLFLFPPSWPRRVLTCKPFAESSKHISSCPTI